MDVKLVLLLLALLTLWDAPVEADFFYNPRTPSLEQTKARGLKCIPGRTVIKIGQVEEEDNDESQETRRTHMNAQTNDETCKVCVCSTEGKDEYCSKRPARNVNECIRISLLKKSMEKSMPFEHERSLAFRIRRDYIWHYDEIPYEAKASCKRSTSYYSNSINANETDIDVGTDVESLLDYSNKDICFFCVCSTDGKRAGCISRSPWFCEYYRTIRNAHAAKDRYHKLFQQDRPGYFRQISYRLRRTMDDGIFTYYDAGGDTLCCNHPDGHRRTLHEQVRTKIRMMRRKVPKENILSKMGADSLNNTCVPFVSEYSDCSEANYCSGCNRCHCTAEGEWSCEEVFMCPVSEDEDTSDQNTVVTALDKMKLLLDLKKKAEKPRLLVPPPPNPKDELIVPEQNPYEENFETWLSRQKRSVLENSGEKSHENTTVKFFHTVDEINEDTLKNSSKTGTIKAQKIKINQIPKISRRTISSDNFNRSALNSLHIKYNQPQDYDPHIAENKIDAISHVTNKINEQELQKLIGNYSQNKKDKDLSKIVVNELKAGDEIIGDKNISPTSNVTFTPENDTLTAMAFIAGNLLSKLWDMEKDTGDDSIETEVLKHEKINDLLELFKEPLSIRQETFLKNALEKLSESLNKNKIGKNVSICETITDSNMFHSSDEKIDTSEMSGVKHTKTKCQQAEHLKQNTEKENQYNVTIGVVSKLNNVLGLIKEFENVQKTLKDVKKHTSTENLNAKGVIEKNPSFELFGTLLDKITKLLIPNKSKNKRVANKLKKSYQFANESSVSNIFENKFNINLGKINITTKDKLVLDYLNHIESNPSCLFRNNIQKKSEINNLNIEGNILYNLSEFFKIKSFVDLMKLTNPETANKQQIKTTTEAPNEVSILGRLLRTSIVVEETQSNSTKEKLIAHLKAIIDDLQQLKKEKGINNAKNINIMDALPCIYKIFSTDDVLNEQRSQKLNTTEVTHLDKMKNVIDTLKIELEDNLPIRRSNNLMPAQELTKSAKIWERLIKNINSAQKNTRRSFNSKKPKTYEELKDIMEKLELMGNSYKNFAIFSIIPPDKRLMLLKTLEADTKRQSFALANIKQSMDLFDKISLDKQMEIKEFIDNVGDNMKLSTKVLKNINKLNYNSIKKSEAEVLFTKSKKQPLKLPKPLNLHKVTDEYKSRSIKLSRDQILNQLIMNRVLLYLKSKEASSADLNDDINYNIGKRILSLIQSGNLNVAKELFRIFIANKQKEEKLLHIRAPTKIVNHSKNGAALSLPLSEPIMRSNRLQKEMELKIQDDFYKHIY